MRYLFGGTIIFGVSFAIVYILAFVRRSSRNKKKPNPFFAWVFSGCAVLLYVYLLPSAGRDADASLLKNREAYRLVLTGMKMENNSGLVSRIFPATNPDTFWIDLPSGTGLQTGRDFLGHSGNYHLFGKIDLRQDHVVVELYFDNAVNKSTDPMDWNGTYTLHRQDSL